MKKPLITLAFLAWGTHAIAQGQLSGDLMTNVNFFQRDTLINAAHNPLYDQYLSGGEAWLGLRYQQGDFSATLRMDAFHNSNLYNPVQAMSGMGIGAWTLQKSFQNLTITGGYIYDQIGSGILFRSYEDRGLLIDNALVGLRLKYEISDQLHLKAFTGQQKFLFDRYAPIIKGFSAEGNFSVGESVFLIPGLGVLNRTLDQTNMDLITSTINGQPLESRFIPRYNMYGFAAYNTLVAGSLSWYLEGAYKTHEALVVDNLLRDAEGTVFYTTLGYAQKGFAVNFSGKRTENFVMRTSPNEVLIRGMLNWQPIVARLRPQRLMARYTPASQDLSERALGLDLLVNPTENLDLNLNINHINTLDEKELYRELYLEGEYRGGEKTIVHAGVQYMRYNQEIYQVKSGVPIVEAYTPFLEITYRLQPRKSLRAEIEYQHTEQDFGSWAFALLEYSIASRWSFAVSDMYNLRPGPAATTGSQHYYNFFLAHTRGAHRFTAAFVRQVEGINCTGGVCRYEPAFSGLKFGITSSF